MRSHPARLGSQLDRAGPEFGLIRSANGTAAAGQPPAIGENDHVRAPRRARSLTGNQMKIIAAAIIGDMLEFFDYFLIGFVLAFIIKPVEA